MTEFQYGDLHRLVGDLRNEYVDANSATDIFEATVRVSAEVLDADVSAIAEKENGGLARLAASPPEWNDSDGLLSPASLPSVIASQGVSYLIEDRGDIRGAADANALSNTSDIQYESVIVVPFGEGKVLLAGKGETAAFTERDLNVLRLIRDIALLLAASPTASAGDDDIQNRVTEAATGLSHDANNFLTVLRGRLQLVREDPQPEHFDAIERAAQRLEELIEDTATLLETGTYVTDLELVPLQEAVNEAWEVAQTEQANLVTGAMAPILAERSRLVQLLENLFRNAIEHAGSDVTVWIGTLSKAQGFYVADNGPGIEPSERESVLEFAYSGDGESTGLGLSIVQWIANAHQWDLSITESEWGGTRFEFRNVEFPD